MKKHIFFYIFILIFAFQTTVSAQDYSLFGLKGKVRTATITEEDDEKLMEIEFDEDGELTSYNGYLIDISSDDWTRSGNSITQKFSVTNGSDEDEPYSYQPSCIDNSKLKQLRFNLGQREVTTFNRQEANEGKIIDLDGNIEFLLCYGETCKLIFKNGKIQSESIEIGGYYYDDFVKGISESYTFEFDNNGFVKKENFISKCEIGDVFNYRSLNHFKSNEIYNYTYTEFDKYGNWTKRKNQHGDIETQKITYDKEWLEEQHRANILQEGTAAEVYEIALDSNSPDSIRQAAAARWSELRLEELTASKNIKGLEDYIKNRFPSAEQKDKAKELWNDVKMEQYKNSEDLYAFENLYNNPLTFDSNKKSIRTRWNNLSWQEAAKKKSADFYAYISTSPMAYEEVAKNGWIQMCEMKYRELIDAQTDFTKVDKYRKLAYALNAIASTVGKFAMDVCLFNSQNFRFITLPQEYTTGSSIMPHKKNPDVFEIMRGKCNRLQSIVGEVSMQTTNLPLGYQRDLQLLKDVTFPAIKAMNDCLDMLHFMLGHIEVNTDILSDPMYDYIFTVEDVNRLTLEGMPFREAYRNVGMQVQHGEYQPTKEVHHTHEGSIGNLCTDRIREKMEKVMKAFSD